MEEGSPKDLTITELESASELEEPLTLTELEAAWELEEHPTIEEREAAAALEEHSSGPTQEPLPSPRANATAFMWTSCSRTWPPSSRGRPGLLCWRHKAVETAPRSPTPPDPAMPRHPREILLVTRPLNSLSYWVSLERRWPPGESSTIKFQSTKTSGSTATKMGTPGDQRRSAT